MSGFVKWQFYMSLPMALCVLDECLIDHFQAINKKNILDSIFSPIVCLLFFKALSLTKCSDQLKN